MRCRSRRSGRPLLLGQPPCTEPSLVSWLGSSRAGEDATLVPTSTCFWLAPIHVPGAMLDGRDGLDRVGVRVVQGEPVGMPVAAPETFMDDREPFPSGLGDGDRFHLSAASGGPVTR